MLKQPALPLDFAKAKRPGIEFDNCLSRGISIVGNADQSLNRRGLCLIYVIAMPERAKPLLARLLAVE